MPTKTKSNRELTLVECELLVPRGLTPIDKESLATVLGLTGSRLQSALAKIMEVLTAGNSRTSSRMGDLLPANRLAALQPTLKAAQKLATCLRRTSVYVDDSDSLETLLSSWIRNASDECDALEKMCRNYQLAIKRGDGPAGSGSDGGARKRNVYKAKETLRDELRSAYREFAADQSVKREQAFVRLMEEVNKRKPTATAMTQWIDSL